MKNQYFGDQTDYIKYGILRTVIQAGAQLGVHWTLTEDDASSDGSRTKYLRAPAQWRHYDPEVFDALAQRVRVGDRRLRVVDELSFIPNSVQSYDIWPHSAEARMKSIQALLDKLHTHSVVFLDPDNGLEVSSVRKGRPEASKYIFLDEALLFWRQGHSVIIYQHYPRVQRIPYVRAQLARLKEVLPDMGETALLTSHVAFLACVQRQHQDIIARAFDKIVERWAPHVGAMGFAGEAMLPRRGSQDHTQLQQELPL